jgi:hypothetical protein
MLFGKKKKDSRKCDSCGGKSAAVFSFCPYCGGSFDNEDDARDFGLLGKNDSVDYHEDMMGNESFGFMDKMLNSMMNSMMKNLDKQLRSQMGDDKNFERAEVRAMPNGIRIKIAGPFDAPKKKSRQQVVRKEIDEKQLQKMNSLPRAKAKTQVKRLGDSVVYELSTPGVNSASDVFVSKLENGYEIKAIGDKKVYVNSVPINLPLKKYSILNNKLLVEFMTNEEVFQ